MSPNDDVRFPSHSRPREALVLLLSIYRLRNLPLGLPFSFFKRVHAPPAHTVGGFKQARGILSRHDDDTVVKRTAVSSLHAFARTASLKVSVPSVVTLISKIRFGEIKLQSVVIVCLNCIWLVWRFTCLLELIVCQRSAPCLFHGITTFIAWRSFISNSPKTLLHPRLIFKYLQFY